MINVGQRDSEARIDKFVRKNTIKYPVIYDKKSEITMDYKVFGVPTVIIADTKGTVLFRQYYVPKPEEITRLLQ